jgi:hypothetical protein
MAAETGQTALDLTIELGWRATEYSEGAYSLRDLTSGETLWSYSWSVRNYGNTGLVYTHDPQSLLIPTFFQASHFYEFMMFGSTNADADSEFLNMRLSGFRPVPEPSSLALIGCGAGLITLVRRRRQPAVVSR